MPTMTEQPHKTLLDREAAKAQISEHFGSQLDALRDVVNYGSNLIFRAFTSSERDMAAIVACFVFLKQIVAMTDAIESLLREGAGHSCHLPARGAFEASLYLQYVIQNDSSRRAYRYYAADLRDQASWARKLTPGTAEADELGALQKSIGITTPFEPEAIDVAKATLDEVDRILRQPNLAAANADLEAAKKKKGRGNPNWYGLEGHNTLRKLAIHLGRLVEYETFYSRGSQVIHTGTYRDHVRFINQELHVHPIRHVIDFNGLMQVVFAVTVGSYRRVIERYRSGETEAFTRKYLSDWKEAFMDLPTVKYEFSPTLRV